MNAPTFRLAHVPGAQGDNCLLGQRGVKRLEGETRPALLISFVYLAKFLKDKNRYAYRDWALDSGAFSAHYSGKAIDLKAYIDTCKWLIKDDPTLTEIFALDVIGDWKKSLENTEKMWAEGIPAIPAYHFKSPEKALLELVAKYPKIALGGIARVKGGVKLKWAQQCFARVWPKRIHGFGFGTRKHLMALPWHSVDATNWETGPCQFGRWNSFGGDLSIRGSAQNLRAEVEWYLKLEADCRARWKKEMEKLEESQGLDVRLAVVSRGDRMIKGIGKDQDPKDPKEAK